MDSTIVTAMAATLGSFVGAAASIATTWIGQYTESKHSHAEWKLRERESLYKEFVAEASRLAVDALTRSMERPDQIIKLYEVLSRIRLISREEVVWQGKACCRRIIEQYGKPKLTTDQLCAAIAADRVDELDPLRAFSGACRNELIAGRG